MWLTYLISAILIYVIMIAWLSKKYPETHLKWEEMNLDDVSFPSSFKWGVATAAHQIEGGNQNNWTEFEQKRGLEASGSACDHWNLWKKDFDLLEELGVTTYRFSIEWSRIQPQEDTFDADALNIYGEMIDDLLNRKIEPMVTLHHFSHPIWFEEKGGFANKDNLRYWESYCQYVIERLGDKVTKWCTINEPEVFSIMGYHMKLFPPGIRSIPRTIRVMKNMILAHGIAYAFIKSHHPETKVGLAKNVTLFDPIRRWNLIDWVTARVLDYIWNNAIISGLQGKRMFGFRVLTKKENLDFIGLNYYTHVLTSPFLPQTTEIQFPKREHEIMTEFGYPMYAEGMIRSTEKLTKLNVPICITENGVADRQDQLRTEHLKRHLKMVSEMIEQGHDIQGYYHWSLMDNFEWAEGYSMCFGLYDVDFETQERTLRESGKQYRNIIKSSVKR